MSSPPLPEAAVAAPRRASLPRIVAKALFGLVMAAALLLLVCWLSLHWLILPHIDEWRAPIESRASRMLGAPVRIGAIEARSSGWVPAIELRDVRILDTEQRPALILPRVSAELSPRSLLAFDLRFQQLLIDGASLDIRRDAAGHIRIGGLDFGSGAGRGEDDGAAADWFFKQQEFVIRGGTLRWIDEARQAPPLALGDVELVVRNGLREHDLRIDATPPAGWGDRFTLRGRFAQPLFARAGDWRRWSGSAYADLPRADVRELRQHVSLPFELSEGNGALRGWFDVRDGQPVAATVDIALRAVALRLDKSVEPLAFEQIEGRVGAEKKGDRVSVAVRRFGFLTGDGVRWPQGDLDFAWHQAEGHDVDSGEFAAQRLDVGVMAQIATRIPLGAALRALLADLHPQGVITQLSTRWSGPLDAPEQYRVKGLLSGLALAARPAAQPDAIGRPGLNNATVKLDASETGGTAQLGIEAGALDLPGVFAEARLPLDHFEAKLDWKIEPAAGDAAPRVTVKVDDARFGNADARGDLHATWRTGPGSGLAHGGRYPGVLELDGHLADARATRAARYLPLGLADNVRSYVARSIRGGTITDATFRIQGDLWDFPFHHAKSARDGEMRIAADVDDVTFAYIPGDAAAAPTAPLAATAAAPGVAASAPVSTWPPLTAMSGQLVVEHGSLDVSKGKAHLGGVAWSGMHARIDSLGDHATLAVDGVGRGPLADMLRYVKVTPIGHWIGGSLAATTASGPAELKLALSIPLDDASDTAVKGSLALAGNDVRMTADTPLLGNAKARVDFSQKGFTVTSGAARVLGGDLAFDGGSSAGLDGGDEQRFSGQGTATAEALRQATELGAVAAFANALTGQAAYRTTLAFVDKRPHIDVASNLVGMAIALPEPLGKAAPTASSLRVRTAPEAPAEGAAAAQQDSLQVELGGALQARFVRAVVGDDARVVRGAIRVVDAPADAAPAREPQPADAWRPLPLPASGVAAQIELRHLDVDAWENAIDRVQPGGVRTSAAAAAPLVFDRSGGQGYVPDAVTLRVADLDASGRQLTHVTAGMTQVGGLWRANVDADELDGYIEYRPARRGAGGAGRVYARLARLSLPKSEEEHVESLLETQPATSIPALDIVADEFELRGKRLGRLEIEAANRGARGGVREWDLSKFNLVMPEARLMATGTWGAAPASASTMAGSRAAMNFTLTLSDSGALLQRLGMGRVIRGGKGTLAGDVSWPGSPLSPDYATMTGNVKVAIDAGQFLKASPGAARLLGVLSLQSLPRRLLLDFRDVFEEGFAFDNVVGDVVIGQGQASTNNLRMRGPAAAVLMEGRADLERETEDLRVLVVPEINAGTASLAYAVINPAIGLGTFLAQYFLRKPLIAASTREFRVTGPWDDPKVERVERSVFGGEAAEATVPPEAAASLPATPR